jgi:mono/diheme cytochrome c family protein
MAKAPTTMPTSMPSSMPAAAGGDLARGRYLVEMVAECADCHTPLTPQGPDMSKRYAGGLEITDATGTWRSRNITQDKKTGIGDWTDQQIIDAIRLGKSKDGSQLFPIMPYLDFNVLTDADVKAMVAYLRTIPGVENQVKASEMKIPKIPAPPPPNQDPGNDPMKKGAYLVTIAGCVECHTPMSKLGPDMTKKFAGGFAINMPPFIGTGTIYSANITSDPDTGIGKYTEQQIIDAMTKGVKANGDKIVGPMVFHMMGWSQMQPDDVAAMAKFVKSIPAVKNTPPKSDYKANPGFPNTFDALQAAMKGAPPPGGKLGSGAAPTPPPGGKLGTGAAPPPPPPAPPTPATGSGGKLGGK